jgi:hypothetical protein
MPGQQIDLTVKQGVNFDYEFTFDNGATPPVATDLSDRTFKSQMRVDYPSPVAAEFVFDKRDQTQDQYKGKLLMSLPYGVTANLPVGTYLYDAIQTYGNGTREELCSGTVTVVPLITR